MADSFMQLINNARLIEDTGGPAPATDLERFDASLAELIRRARLQAGELALMIQRMEKLRLDIRTHLPRPRTAE
ncbi:hypothetical protein [Catelliglobosispora koreensis]|uniref:hypothetical protein n=1 Tax=Catelliglobosispora koreensis TaxID=129052 RepID=UPI00036D1038|nr:hypothetical protein [Catelliglobosispora koreensis]